MINSSDMHATEEEDAEGERERDSSPGQLYWSSLSFIIIVLKQLATTAAPPANHSFYSGHRRRRRLGGLTEEAQRSIRVVASSSPRSTLNIHLFEIK